MHSKILNLLLPNGITVSVIPDVLDSPRLVEVALRKEGRFIWDGDVRLMTPLQVLKLLDEVQRF